MDEVDIQSNINEEVDAGLGKQKCICGTWITEEQSYNHLRWSETHHQYITHESRSKRELREMNNPDSVIVD